MVAATLPAASAARSSATGAARTIASRRLAHNPGGELAAAKIFSIFSRVTH